MSRRGPGGHSRLAWLRLAAACAVALGACTDEPAAVAPPPPPPPLSTHVDDWRDEIIYQLLVDRFENGDPTNDAGVDLADPYAWHGGDWQGVIDRLDYLEALGVTTLWISPVVKNVDRGYHGYWTSAFDRVNDHFGDEAKLRELVDACHARGIKVILDVVVNHVGQLFFYDLDGDGQEDDGEFNPDYAAAGIDAPIVFFDDPASGRVAPTPAAFQDPAWYSRRGKILDWNVADQVVNGDFPSGGLKDLKTSSPEVRQALVDVYVDWIRRTDADGFRIDTLKHVEQSFWREFCPAVRRGAKALGKEKFFLFGEAFDGNADVLASYTKNFAVDSVVDFRLKFGGFNEVFQHGGGADGTAALEQIWQEKEAKFESRLNPDGIGVPSTRVLVNFIDNHDVPRFLAEKPSPAALRSALAYLFTYDGVPCLYQGTEQEFSGGADPANREDLFASGFAEEGETFRYVARLAALRKEHEALRRGESRFRWTSDRTNGEADAGIVAFERFTEAERLLVVINVSDSGSSETSGRTLGFGDMAVGFPAGTNLTDLLSEAGERFTVAADGTLVVPVPARGARLLAPAP